MFKKGGVLLLVLFLYGCAAPRQATLGPPGAPPVISAAGLTHTVTGGQTLYHISRLYHVEVSELLRVNIIRHPSRLEVGQKLFIPRGEVAPPSAVVPIRQDIRRLVGLKRYTAEWRTITLHHSATRSGGARLFDRDHRRRNMGGLFYHFVIGNGTSTGDGQIEVGWRWRKQVKANRPYDIQICLVGNFDEQIVSTKQYRALVDLIRVLSEQYHIPRGAIRRHKDIHDKHTDCPGKNFPFHKLLADAAGG